MSIDIKIIPDYEADNRKLRKQNEHLLAALIDIQNEIDRGDVRMIDLQQRTVGIKGLRGILNSDKLLSGDLKPGLVR
jgi:hypothetical protein